MNKPYKAVNAIIMAAGLASRFAPLSYEYPKSLVEVKGEILIERQIKQLQEVGIDDITIVVGYKKELFNYLVDKYQVNIVENPEYNVRNNSSTLYYVKERLANTYVCSSDNYFSINVFDSNPKEAYYSSVFNEGITDEWCLKTDDRGLITDVKVGGEDSWVMLGHAFFTEEFSKHFVEILEDVYYKPETASMFWESIYIDNIDELPPMYIQKYPEGTIFEFDTLDELRAFDNSYWNKTGSDILEHISWELNCKESDITNIEPLKDKENKNVVGFQFQVGKRSYNYDYETHSIKNLNEGRSLQ